MTPVSLDRDCTHCYEPVTYAQTHEPLSFMLKSIANSDHYPCELKCH